MHNDYICLLEMSDGFVFSFDYISIKMTNSINLLRKKKNINFFSRRLSEAIAAYFICVCVCVRSQELDTKERSGGKCVVFLLNKKNKPYFVRK